MNSQRPEYLNSKTHLLGAVAAFSGVTVLIVLSSIQGDAWKIVSFSIYGLCLFLLYLISTLYHSSHGRYKDILRKLDHIAIYLLIAGSYMPFTLVSLRGVWGWTLFGIIWALAITGIVIDAVSPKGKRIVPVIIYILMGWLGLIAINPLIQSLSVAGFMWLLAGGLFYTIGIIFFVLDYKNPYYHTVWHLFVLAGSAAHFTAMYLYVL